MEKIWFAEYQKTGIPETVELPPENTSLIDIFERNFQKFGSRDAFIFMDKVMSFSELELASRKFAAYLQSLGLVKGSRVAVSSNGYGFKSTAKQLDTNAKAGKTFLTVADKAKAMPLLMIENYTHLAILSSAGRLLLIDLSELPVLNKGKGNKLIQLEDKEQILSMTTVGLNEIIQVLAGNQQLKLKGEDLQKYVGKRASKGHLLPRGYQKANRLLVQR